MDYLLTIVKETPENKCANVDSLSGKGKLLFILTNIDNDDTEILYKSYYPSIDSRMLDNLQPLHESKKKEEVERRQFDFKNVLKRTIDEFVDFTKGNSHKLFINFDNSDPVLTRYLRDNYQRHVLKATNVFRQEVVGTTFTKRVSDYFNSHNLLNTVRIGLCIKDFTIEKSKELM